MNEAINSNDSGKVSYMKHYCQKVLPAVYDDSLSYYESICKMVAKVNELVDSVNNITLDILSDANAYTDAQLSNYQNQVDTLVSSMCELKNHIDNELVNADNNLKNEVNKLSVRIDKANQKSDELFFISNNRTDMAIERNNEYIFSQMEKNILSTIAVINFFTGERMSVQEMFNYLAGLHLENSLTYNQLALKDLTVLGLIQRSISYTELVKNGNTLL
jgi:hypothetical protein